MKPLKPLYNALYQIIFAIAMVLVRILYPIFGYGKENLIRGKGFVLAPNHLAAIDPFFIMLARGFGQKMLVMGKQELFDKNALLNFFWNIAGVFPVARGSGNRGAVTDAVNEVKKGRGLLVFPEGTRSKDGKLGRLKSGAFVVALEAEAVITPCIICYKAGRPKMFRRTNVAFGKPVTLEELGLTGEYTPKKLRAAKEAYAKVLGRLREEYCEQLER